MGDDVGATDIGNGDEVGDKGDVEVELQKGLELVLQ